MSRYTLIAALLCLTIAPVASAQTVEFTTNAGSFDMVLNPTNNPNLQPLVDNLIAYIGLGRYHFSAVNRASDGDTTDPLDDFVLQMGGFMAFPPEPQLWAQLHTSVESFDGVVVDANGDGQVDFDTAGLTNSRGTISLALAGGDPNSGTSSFFVNLGDNAFLDDQGFVPFAVIDDLTTIDEIMSLSQIDLGDEIGQPGNLAFIDVPLVEDDRIVVVTDVEVIDADDDFSFVGPIANALQLASRNSSTATSAAQQASLAVPLSAAPSTPAVMVIPEPTAPTLAALALVAIGLASKGTVHRGRLR